jgi:opacity protein-like surface antigen
MQTGSSMFRRFSMGCLVAATMLAAAAPAGADGFVTPFVGVNFGGATDKAFNNALEDNSKLAYGASIGWMGAGVFGLEADFGYSPKFIAPAADLGQTNVMTITGNLILGVPLGGQHGFGVRPYVVAGVGLIRTSVDGTLSDFVPDRNSFGYDLGGGLNIYFADHVGIRGDLRYFRDFSVTDAGNLIGVVLGNDKLDFFRGSAGLVLRF